MERRGRCGAGVVIALLAGCGRIAFEPLAETTSSWWDPAWAYRKALVIDHDKVAGDLAGFPVLVALDDADLAAHARADGGDLVFVDAMQMPLAHELDVFRGSTLRAWVVLPALPRAVDTTFFLYYGGPSRPADPRAVWANGFASVYHFGDGISLDIRDSTSANDATANAATPAPGQIGGAARYTGVSGSTAGATNVDATPGRYNTVTYWMNYAEPYGKGPFVFESTSGVYDTWFFADGCFGFNTGNGEVLGTTVTGLAGRWVHVAAVFYNGVPDTAHNTLYIDGVARPLSPCAPGTPSARNAGTLVYWGGNASYEMTGMLDECRIANGIRSAEWIATEYANQTDPSFVGSGSEQLAGAP